MFLQFPSGGDAVAGKDAVVSGLPADDGDLDGPGIDPGRPLGPNVSGDGGDLPQSFFDLRDCPVSPLVRIAPPPEGKPSGAGGLLSPVVSTDDLVREGGGGVRLPQWLTCSSLGTQTSTRSRRDSIRCSGIPRNRLLMAIGMSRQKRKMPGGSSWRACWNSSQALLRSSRPGLRRAFSREESTL